MLINVKKIVLPCLKELKKSPLDAEQAARVELIEKYLREILSPFVNNYLEIFELVPAGNPGGQPG